MALRLKQAFETEVYVTEGGYVAIKQPEPDDPSHETLILLTAEQLPHVISELQALFDDRASWEFGEPDETDDHDAKPPTTQASGATAKPT